jgi:two-component system, OmpR family, phosphate regulon sensor histidine kinase PhoR
MPDTGGATTLDANLTFGASSPFQGENPFLQLLQGMMDGILICHPNGNILFFNALFQNQFHLPSEAINQPLQDFLPNTDLHEALHQVFETGESVSTLFHIRLNNQDMVFQLHVVAMALAPDINNSKSNNTSLFGCVAVFHDITAIKRTEKMRRDFVANVSHELRTPLSAIKGYSETLLDGALEDEQVARDFVDVIHRHSIRLSQLVEDLLDLSKLESPDFVPELKPLSLRPLINRVVALMEDEAQSKDIALYIHLPEDLPKALANSSNLEQVFTNLLGNAIKYTPDGGKIGISAFLNKDNSFIQVSLKDTGLGMEPKHIPRLFERFYRVDKARSRELGGTGLGLSIVKHIVQLHGGEIWVESELNKGSTFHFTLIPQPEF